VADANADAMKQKIFQKSLQMQKSTPLENLIEEKSQ
jgi:hypothetical protein